LAGLGNVGNRCNHAPNAAMRHRFMKWTPTVGQLGVKN